MSKQAHDPGVKKSKTNQKPMDPKRLQWLRIKRHLPGPLPLVLRDFREWDKAGRPTRFK